MEIIPVEEHAMLVFWVEIVVLVAVARLLGGLMKRVGQPAVIGELAAGLILGPSVLGKLWPAGAEWLFPPHEAQSAMLLAVGWLGIVMLLVVTGFETDLALIRQLGRAAVTVATGSVVVPFLLGLGAGFVLPSSFAPQDKGRLIFALFVAAALSISSLPVIAKILSELGLTRRNFGQITLAAGMANDVVGWLILGAIAGVARSGELQLGRLGATVLGMVVFLALAATVGQRMADTALRRVRERSAGLEGALAVTLLGAFVAGAVTQALGVEAVLGAFVAGIVLGRSRFQSARVLPTLEAVTASVFAPLFFATAGLRVDLSLLARPDVVVWAVVVILVASAGKFAGAYVGGHFAGLVPRESLALGVALNARGALEIVIATVGLSLGVLNPRAYTVIVLMAVATSVAAPPLLRALAKGWAGTTEEQQRLEREETLRTNVFVRPGRFLVPVQRGDGSLIAARILDLAWPRGHGATVVAVDDDGKVAAAQFAEVICNRAIEEEELHSSDRVLALVDHMRLGYRAVGMGACEGRGECGLLSPLTEGLLAQSTLPVLLVWEGPRAKIEAVRGFRHILVPVVGTVPSRAAQELAFSLAAHTDADVTITSVSTGARELAPVDATRGGVRTRDARRVAGGAVAEAVELARRFGVKPRAVVREGSSRAEEIVALAREVEADLIILSAELQSVAGELFLGNLVERVVAGAETTVGVVAVPHEWRAPTRS